MTEFVEVASGLRFPEGPVALPDGSVVLVEMMGRCITRITPDGTKQTVAKIAGGPNGLALGPDGALYLCNNGGSFSEQTINGLTYPGPFDPSLYIGGRIQRVDLNTGAVTDLYTHCDGHQLRGPNDIVFDRNGGMWFTDHGIRHERVFDLTGIYYAKTDGSMIREVIFPCQAPNGIGLSPDGETLYWAETFNGRVNQATITGDGEIKRRSSRDSKSCLCGLAGLQYLDSLAVDGEGNVCVATLGNGGITVISKMGEILEHIATSDPITTNICFGGPDFQTAYITLSGVGKLVSMKWPYKGLRLNFL
ncbi:MAG: SMP-30/gluconolactonase/LRE family protein [Actinomycetota bacterium]|nr:SMP-30/gluconolactonase/LRE family protein [Actinomycetota bacterium]